MYHLLDQRNSNSTEVAVGPLIARQILQDRLQTFLDEHSIQDVRFAKNSVPPPPLAYVVRFPRLTITLAGTHKMELEVAGLPQTISSGRGDAVFIPGNCWNKPDWQASGTILNILFGRKQVGLSMVQQTIPLETPESVVKTAIPGSLDHASYRMLEALHEFGQRPEADAICQLLVKALLHSCVLSMARLSTVSQNKSKVTFESICTYVQENFQKPISREQIADTFDISPNHVSRLFRKEGFMTFSDYLTFVRIDRAKYMLRSYTAMTLDEIATGCGYQDTSYFCRIFKNITRKTPSSYRFMKA